MLQIVGCLQAAQDDTIGLDLILVHIDWQYLFDAVHPSDLFHKFRLHVSIRKPL